MDKKTILENLINHYTDGNKAKFAAKIGVKPQTINTWISRNSFDIELLYAKCEGVNASWLLTGEGEMLTGEGAAVAVAHDGGDAQAAAEGAQSVNVHNGDNSPASLTGDITITAPSTLTTEKELELTRLRERVKYLEAAVGDKDARIADLRDTIALLRDSLNR